MKLFFGVIMLSISLIYPAIAGEYKEIEVTNGGTIVGVVKVKGNAPKDEMRRVRKDEEHCGTTIPAEKYVISPDGGVKWAVVMLEDITQGKKLNLAQTPVLDNQNCQFVPHVMVAPTGGKLTIRNSDPMLHNSHFYLIRNKGRKKNVINLALPKQGQEVTKARILRRSGLLSVECDAHDFMQAWVWSLPHPYAVVTDDNGHFELTDVPPGTYTLKVWHEGFGEKTMSVTVEAGKATEVMVEYQAQ